MGLCAGQEWKAPRRRAQQGTSMETAVAWYYGMSVKGHERKDRKGARPLSATHLLRLEESQDLNPASAPEAV